MLLKSLILVLYAIVIIIIGFRSFRQIRSTTDFVLGGGRVGAFLSAFSYGTAYFSAVLFVGFAGKIGWNFGLSSIWIGVFNALIGVFLVWILLAWRVKQQTTQLNVSTMTEFFEKRYHSRTLKILSSIVIFIFLIPYSAAVFMGLSYLFEVSLGIPFLYVLIAMGFFTAFYVTLGGYRSMALLDAFFGIIMIVSVIVLIAFTLKHSNGLGSILDALESAHPALTRPVGPPGLMPLLSIIILTSIAPFAMPQLVQKFYAIRDKAAIRRGAVISAIFAFIIGCTAYFLGASTRFFISETSHPHLFSNGKPHFDYVMPEFLTTILPDSFHVIILLLLLSASMSTLASLVLISTATFVKDFYSELIQHNMTDSQKTFLMRLTSLLFVFLAVFFAAVEIDVIVEILGISWGAIGSFFLGPFMWGVFSTKVPKVAAFVSGFVALGICVLFYMMGYSSPEAGSIGMICSMILPLPWHILKK